MCMGRSYTMDEVPISNQELGIMKPRSKVERMLVKMAAHLPELTERQIRFGRELFEKKGYTSKNEVWCQCCGTIGCCHPDRLSENIDFHCPKCGNELSLSPRARKKTKDEMENVTFITTYKGWQVARTFVFWRYNTYGKETDFGYSEVYQNWIRENGKEYITGKSYNRGVYSFQWYYDSEFSIKFHNEHVGGYYVWDDVFDISGNKIYPTVRVLPIVRRNGWTKDLIKKNINHFDLMQKLITNPEIEWLVKIKEYQVLSYLIGRGDHTIRYKHAVKIAHKNGYKIKNASMWYDYLDLLSYFGKDTHNAHYVCPDNLEGEHDWLVRKKEAKRKKEALREQIKKAKENEENYKEFRGKFFGLSFSANNIYIHVLESVQEFTEEAKDMHHCVFECGYWNKKDHPDSLILSARDDKGKRIETIEVNTNTWKIEQSRGHCNQPSPQHEEIINMVNNYMPKIRLREHTAKIKKITNAIVYDKTGT